MNPFQDLLTQSPGRQVSPELLEALGRKASQMFQTQGIPLNQAIAQLAGQYSELGNEHIKRIVEFANNVTFQEQFQSGQDKNVHFNIADPGIILRDLKDGGTPSHDGKPLGNGDYAKPPVVGAKESGTLDHELENLFTNRYSGGNNGGEAEQVKMASAQGEIGGHANPVEDVYDLHVRLRATREKLAEAHEVFDLALQDAREGLYQIIRREIIEPDGAGLGGVIGGLEKMASADFVADVMEPLIGRLVAEGVPNLSASLEKKAGRFLNTDHPLAKTWAGLLKAAEEQVRAATALADVDKGLAEAELFLKQAMGGEITTGVRKAVSGGTHGKVMPALRQRFPKGA